MRPQQALPVLLSLLLLSACKGGDKNESIDTGPYDDDQDGVLRADDCDDNSAYVGAMETWYIDDDGDGYGSTASSKEACGQPSGFVDNGDDCDDSTEFVSPIARERCDELDNDCDGTTDEDDAYDALPWYPDEDGDGYGDMYSEVLSCVAPEGTLEDGTDCDDARDDVHPGVCEVCGDDVDNDCDGIEICTGLGDADSVLYGDGRFYHAGKAARGVGDLNGDDYDDIAIGATGAGEGKGAVYAFLAPIPLGAQTVEGATASLEGTSTFELLGQGLAAAGDTDGDGYPEIAVGSPGDDTEGVDAGKVQIWSGPGLDLTATITGEAEGDQAGTTIAGLGDVDDDSYDDLLIGAPSSNSGEDLAGAVFLLTGPFDENTYAGDSTAVYYGESEGQYLGTSLTSAGDYDGDGYTDFLFGADGENSTSGQTGAVWVVYGPQIGVFGTSDVDVKWFGEALGDAAAYPANIGDVNGDGLPDIGIASPGAIEEDVPDSGIIYIWYGAHYTVIDNVRHGDAFLTGNAEGDALWMPIGGTTRGFGDLTGDGYGELWVGAKGEDTTAAEAGAAYLVPGPLEGATTLCACDIQFFGEAAGDAAGTTAVDAGDINNDGTLDLLVTAPYNDAYGDDAGATYVLSGASFFE